MIAMRKVLNVGGNSKTIPLPPQYNGWDHVLLDIDPTVNPDVLCDARNLSSLAAKQYDSVYCSHNLEHYYHHDVARVLAGFIHVLKDDGFVFIRVPDMKAIMKMAVERDLDMDDALLQVPDGYLTVRDVIYGWEEKIEQSGCDFFAHKTGFSQNSLLSTLQSAGFSLIFIDPVNGFELYSVAFKNHLTEYTAKLFGLPYP
jgi:SAM-dependent methyltransferase